MAPWVSGTPYDRMTGAVFTRLLLLPASANLPAPSVVRMKLFTLDHRFIIAKRGKLSEKDRKAVNRALKSALDL